MAGVLTKSLHRKAGTQAAHVWKQSESAAV